MLRVGFENFVWLSPAEIVAALQAKSPLFAGYLPETSPLADIFDAALTDALAAKGITAKVDAFHRGTDHAAAAARLSYSASRRPPSAWRM